jgi:hypothetical protein
VEYKESGGKISVANGQREAQPEVVAVQTLTLYMAGSSLLIGSSTLMDNFG